MRKSSDSMLNFTSTSYTLDDMEWVLKQIYIRRNLKKITCPFDQATTCENVIAYGYFNGLLNLPIYIIYLNNKHTFCISV